MVEFNNKVKARVSGKWVCELVGGVLGNLKKKGDVSVVFVSDKEIRELNKKYRNKDEATDVLSFCEAEGEEVIIPKGSQFLGEVIIGYKQAKRQALSQGHSLKRELAILLVHGTLHVLGYDHERSGQEAEVMEGKEDELLSIVKLLND